MDKADEDDCNFWWGVELEAEGSLSKPGENAEETLLTMADLSGSVGSELFEEDGKTVLRAVYLGSRDVSHWLAALDALKKDFPGARVRAHSKIENRPWHTEHMDAFPPIPVGAGLVVAAPWHSRKLDKENESGELAASGRQRLPIYIYPSSAFGTGYHESTQIGLSFVERFIKSGDVVLDVGTGSGILFIAALKLGAARAAACDIDPVAIAEAKRNMEINGLPGSSCELRVGDLWDGAAEADLLMSNILLKTNFRLLGEMSNLLKPFGTAVFSGMTTAERAVFLPALSESGLSLLAELTINDWWGCAARWNASGKRLGV
ncbi:MAG: 50S ribosomal protein L11 methyltransferase [Synergistaceae bacterium]|nr:50S ribosomal protein L11 methyltransferase [Synergistaceae bacterium]